MWEGERMVDVKVKVCTCPYCPAASMFIGRWGVDSSRVCTQREMAGPSWHRHFVHMYMKFPLNAGRSKWSFPNETPTTWSSAASTQFPKFLCRRYRHFLIPTVWRTSGIARPSRSPFDPSVWRGGAPHTLRITNNVCKRSAAKPSHRPMPQSVQPVCSNDLKFPHALAVRSEPAVKKKKENTEPPPLLGVAMVGTDVHASSSLLAFYSKIYVSPHLLARKVFPVTINTFGNRTVSKARVPCSPREGGLRNSIIVQRQGESEQKQLRNSFF